MDFILAHSRYKRRRFDEAIQICDNLLQKNPKDQAAWILKCQALVKDNYVDELETQQQNLADLMTQQNEHNKFARAGTSFKNSTSHNPVMRPMSNGRLNTGFQRVGTSLGSRSGSRANNNKMLRTGRVMTKGGVPTTSNGRVLRLSTASLQQYGQNFFDSGKADLRRIAQRRSKARTIFLYLFYVEHNVRKALQLAIYATQMNNYQDPWWKLALGKCYYCLSFYPQAQKQLLSSVKHNNNIQSSLYLSRIYQKQDNVQKSIKVLRDAIQVNPYQPRLSLWVGRIYDELGDFQKSYHQYQNALKLQNCNIEAVANIASYYFYKDQAEISMKLYQRLLELGYSSSEVWNNLALCCFANNQFNAFYNCFQRALRMTDDDPQLFTDIWYNVGYVYSMMGDLDMAQQAYQLSLNYVPENVQALNNLAIIYWRNENMQWAINYAQKSFRASPNFQAAFNLSLWYFNSHQYERSYNYNKQTLKLYPDHAQSHQLTKKLRKKLELL